MDARVFLYFFFSIFTGTSCRSSFYVMTPYPNVLGDLRWSSVSTRAKIGWRLNCAGEHGYLRTGESKRAYLNTGTRLNDLNVLYLNIALESFQLSIDRLHFVDKWRKCHSRQIPEASTLRRTIFVNYSSTFHGTNRKKSERPSFSPNNRIYRWAPAIRIVGEKILRVTVCAASLRDGDLPPHRPTRETKPETAVVCILVTKVPVTEDGEEWVPEGVKKEPSWNSVAIRCCRGGTRYIAREEERTAVSDV